MGWPEIVDQRLDVVGEGREQHTAIALDAELLEAVGALVEIGAEPALAANPALEGNADEVAPPVVAPAVVDAGVIGAIPVELAAHGGAAMGAAIDEGVDLAVVVAVVDHGRIAKPGSAEVARVRHLGLEAEERATRARGRCAPSRARRYPRRGRASRGRASNLCAARRTLLRPSFAPSAVTRDRLPPPAG